MCEYPVFFAHSSVLIHLGCFHALAIVHSTAMNVGMHLSFQIVVSSGLMPKKWDCWVLWYFSILFLMNLCSVLLCGFTDFCSYQQGGGLFFLHTLSSSYYCRFFEADHSDLHELISHCTSDSQFSNT